MKILVDKNAEMKVEICLGELENGKIACWAKDDDIPLGIKKSSIENHVITFRVPTYKDNMLFLDAGLKISPSGEISVVSNQLKYTRFITLLKSWTFVDDSGNPLPATEEMANQISPSIVDLIVFELEEQIVG